MKNMAESVKSIIQGFLITLEKERGYSKLTIKAYRNDLNRFYDFLRNYHGQDNLDLGSIDRQTIRHFLGMEYDKKYSSKTVARRLASVKSFFKYLVKAEEIEDNVTLYHSVTLHTGERVPGENLTDLIVGEAEELRFLQDRLVGGAVESGGEQSSKRVGVEHGKSFRRSTRFQVVRLFASLATYDTIFSRDCNTET